MGEMAYLIANVSVVPVWLLLVFAPRARITERMASTPLIPALHAALYVALLVGSMAMGGGGDLSSLAGLRQAFQSDTVLLLAWVHYLCFDMVVGMWLYRDARRLGITWWAAGPCLVGTLMFGPAGFLGYAVARRIMVGAVAWDKPAT